MTENFHFRSSMNGFNRNDVIQYLDDLLTQKAESDIKAATAKKEADELKAENEELKAAADRLNSELEELKAECARLREINQTQTEKLSSDNKCEECEIVKVYEARLGAAMLDAKRFSEILVKEANDKAATLFSDAFASADRTSVKAKDIARNITEINNQFNVSFKLLLDNMNSLGKSLDSFKSEVKATGDMFDFSTDFLPISADGKYVNDKTRSSKLTSDFNSSGDTGGSDDTGRVASVNFDDADEFDIRVDVNV